MSTITLKVFSQNIWGIPLVSKFKSERVNALKEALVSKEYDVICLQEVWNTDDFVFLRTNLESTMPHAYYFYSGLLGSGLCIYSKWPIVNTFYYKFPLNGYVHKVHHGDWLAGKGVALAQIVVNNKIVNVFNIHLHAQYCEENDEYHAHRLSQAYEAGQMIKLMSESGALSLLIGDCNSKPSDLCFKLMCSLAQLEDSFLDLKREQDYGTSETPRNSFAPPAALKINAFGARVDYILFRSNSAHEAKSISYAFALPERVPGKDFSYSDHEAIEATIELKEKQSYDPRSSYTKKDAAFIDIIRESYQICENGLQEITRKSKMLGSCALAIISILIVASYQFGLDHGFSYYLLLSIFTSAIPLFLILYRIEYQSLRSIEQCLATLENYLLAQQVKSDA